MVLFAVGAAAFAAGDDFYQRMLQRGMEHFAAANYASAYDELRMAAFGFVDSIDDFELAHIYAAVAAQKLQRESDTRSSLQRVLAAEKIEHRYNALKLPEAVRGAFEQAARTLLRRDELSQLRIGVTTAPPPAAASLSMTVQTTPPPQAAPQAQQPTSPALQQAAAQPVNVDAFFVDAERAMRAGDLEHARSVYRLILDMPSLNRPQLLRVAEGLYRTADFQSTVRAFARLMPLAAPEEPYRYYYAVALYETASYAAAKRELAAALPFIELTPDVARYRAKIERAPE